MQKKFLQTSVLTLGILVSALTLMNSQSKAECDCYCKGPGGYLEYLEKASSELGCKNYCMGTYHTHTGLRAVDGVCIQLPSVSSQPTFDMREQEPFYPHH